MRFAQQATVAVVGCGFAGLGLVRELRRRRGNALRIVVFEKQSGLYNYPVLPRLLYETLAATDIEVPYRLLLADLDVDLRRERVNSIDPANSLARSDASTVSYDYLVVATGSRARPLPQDDGVFVYYPKAMRHLDRLRAMLRDAATESARHFAVVGGGLTGIEFALAMRDAFDAVDATPGAKRHPASTTALHLFEQHDRLVPRHRAALSSALHRELVAAGVEVHLNSRVVRATPGGLVVGQRVLPMDTVVCCIGAKPELRLHIDGLAPCSDGLVVDDTLRIAGQPRLFAIGDVMALQKGKSPEFELHMAHRAAEQGQQVARNIERLLGGYEARRYVPRARPVSVLSHAGRGVLAFRSLCVRGRLAGQLKRWLDLRHVQTAT